MNQEQRRFAGVQSASLWASAFVLMGLLLLQAGRIHENPAYGDMASRVGGFTIMTTEGGNDEVIVVIDNRNEDLLLYRVRQQRELELLQKLDLDRLFADARRAASGRR